MILLVGTEVLGEVVDPLGENGDLNSGEPVSPSWRAYFLMISVFSLFSIVFSTFSKIFAALTGLGRCYPCGDVSQKG